MKIILLGEGCKISWNMQKINLKGESSIFEWFLSVSFKDINIIVEKMLRNIDINITSRPNFRDIFLDTTAIRSSHYSKDNFKDRLERRVERFKSDILDSDNVLFIREEHNGYTTTVDDINKFKELIENFHPSCNYKILLLMPPDISRDQLIIDKLYHKKNLTNEFKLLEYIENIKNDF